jgi:hypothetical protein
LIADVGAIIWPRLKQREIGIVRMSGDIRRDMVESRSEVVQEVAHNQRKARRWRSEDVETIDVQVLLALDPMGNRVRAELRVTDNNPFDLVKVALGPSDLALIRRETHAEW